MITVILLIISLVFYTLKSLDFTYIFQIKEYRFDRIMTFFREENPVELLFLRKIKFPAITFRNFLIVQGIFFNTLYFTAFLLKQSILVNLLFLLFTPVTAFLTMLLGVILSEIPVQLYRRRIILQAMLKVRSSKAIFIGITGSYGKTTTKEFLFQILSQKFRVGKTDRNFNSEIGVALSILKNLRKDTQFFIAEIGAYKKGEVKAVCNLIRPKYGILTGIGNQHLALFGSKQKLIETKAELLEALPADGMAFINQDISEWKFLAEKTKSKKYFYTLRQIPAKLKTRFAEDHNLQNLLPCIALAKETGISEVEINKAINKLRTVKGRLSQENGINGSTVLNDSYNSNVEGFLAAIQAAKLMKFSQKFIISRGLIELGSEKKSSYKKILESLNTSDLTLLTTDRLFKYLSSNDNVIFFNTEYLLLTYLKSKLSNNSLLVIEGRFEPKTIDYLCQSV